MTADEKAAQHRRAIKRAIKRVEREGEWAIKKAQNCNRKLQTLQQELHTLNQKQRTRKAGDERPYL